MKLALLFSALLLSAAPATGFAQDPRDLEVRTFTLRHMKPDEAAKLLGPYVTAPGGGVFDAGIAGAITVRETFTNLRMVDSLLKLHDRPRAAILMKFQLIAALDSAKRDPGIDAVDAELRKLFRFPGYELIGEGTARTEEVNDFIMTLSTKGRWEGKDRIAESFQIRGWIDRLDGTGESRALRATIALRSVDSPAELLSTGLTIPIGQSLILGSARPTMTFGNRVALILVVQPEVVGAARR